MSDRRYRTAVVGLMGLALLVTMVGCGGTSLAIGGGKMAYNLMKKGSNLKIMLDAQPAKQSTLKKAIKGTSEWKIPDPVTTSPTLRFEFRKPDYFGRITATTISIFQQYRGDYSHQAEFVLTNADNEAGSMLKPTTDYNLGSPPKTLKVFDVKSNPVEGVKLIPGMKYKIMLTIKGDRSETALVYFDTK